MAGSVETGPEWPGCEFNHPSLGRLGLCGSCDDHEPPEEHPKCGASAVREPGPPLHRPLLRADGVALQVRDQEACLAGAGMVWSAAGLVERIIGWGLIIVIMGGVTLWALLGVVRREGEQARRHCSQTRADLRHWQHYLH